MNGLERAKNRGRGRPLKENREKKWISRCLKQGVGLASLRKREIKCIEGGLKTGGRAGQPKEKRKNKWNSRG